GESVAAGGGGKRNETVGSQRDRQPRRVAARLASGALADQRAAARCGREAAGGLGAGGLRTQGDDGMGPAGARQGFAASASAAASDGSPDRGAAAGRFGDEGGRDRAHRP